MDGPGQIRDEKIGAQLNAMSGIRTDKDLYAAPKGTMDKDAFLKMFMEQLKFQDPMNPVKNENFGQQLAMFSQLEQQVTMNKNLEKIAGNQNNTQIAALQLVGKTISADRAAIYHDKTKPFSTQNFKLSEQAVEMKAEILDAGGNVVKTVVIGPQDAGPVSFKWDGRNENDAPVDSGRYGYRIIAKGVGDKEITVSNKIEGRVNGVSNAGGAMFLLVGDQKVALNEIDTIKEPSGDGKNDGKTAGTIPAFNPVSSGKTDGAEQGTDEKTAQAKVSIGQEAIEALKKNENGQEEGVPPLMPFIYR